MILRDPIDASTREHDLVIIGGGIYGACLALEAARRGLKPLLLEKGDFGEATSWNSLRILHGGLRYLQALDLRRFRQSVRERRWFCGNFPELVQSQECLMPLYGNGLKRPSIFGAALFVNDLLSYDRNAGVDVSKRIGRGHVLNAHETVKRFPQVDRRDLRGAGVWYDATMVQSQRVLVEILHWACGLGATALNYVAATRLVKCTSGISGVEARDTRNGSSYSFVTRLVCNCAGPWSSDVAERFDRTLPTLFRPSLAFNVLLDCTLPSASAVAIAPRRSDGRREPVYFLYPAFGGVLAGTVHLPWTRDAIEKPEPTEEQLERFLDDLNAAVPGWNLRREQIVRVFAGLLPVKEDGSSKLTVRPTIWDHGRHDGPRGLVSVSGVKFTTARLVAEKTLALLAGQLRISSPSVTDARRPPITSSIDFARPPVAAFSDDDIAGLQRLVREEAVMTVDDLLFRRLSWAITAPNHSVLRRRVAEVVEPLAARERQSSHTGVTSVRREPASVPTL